MFILKVDFIVVVVVVVVRADTRCVVSVIAAITTTPTTAQNRSVNRTRVSHPNYQSTNGQASSVLITVRLLDRSNVLLGTGETGGRLEAKGGSKLVH